MPTKAMRAQCSKHPLELLSASRTGWFCAECGAITVASGEWATPDERIRAGLLLEKLPAPLAIKAVAIDEEDHPLVRLWSVCELTEVLLRVCVAVTAADLRSRGGLPDRVARVVIPRILRPTLDGWEHCLAELLQALGPAGLLPELYADFETLIRPLLRQGDFAIVSLRNDLAHGGGYDRASAKNVVGEYVRRTRNSLASLSWLPQLQLTASCKDQVVVLAGPSLPVLPASFPSVQSELADLKLEVRRGKTALDIWPMLSVVVPAGDTSPTLSIYVRSGDECLEHLPIGHSSRFEKLRKGPWKKFREWFRLGERASILGELGDFNSELEDDARTAVGRSSETKLIAVALDDPSMPRVLWVHGSPGVGKSKLAGKLFSHLRGQGRKVIAWRFRAGDPRCSRSHFLRHLLIGLEAFRKQESLGDDSVVLERFVRDALGRADGRTVVLIDGLDEIASHEPAFAELPLRLAASANVRWVCFGRPTEPVRNTLETQEVLKVFPENGVGPLPKEDIEEWLKRDISDPQRARLVREDNKWIDRVLECSGGLPQYIALLLDELGEGGVVVGESNLPRGLDAYWARLLRSHGVDDLSRMAPEILTAVAILAEAPTSAFLCEVLARTGSLVPSGATADERMVDEAINRIRALVRCEPVATPRPVACAGPREESVGSMKAADQAKESAQDISVSSATAAESRTLGNAPFRILPAHESLREHILSNEALKQTVYAVSKAIDEIMRQPLLASRKVAQSAAFSQGVHYFLVRGRISDAEAMLHDFGYLMARTRMWGRREASGAECIGAIVADLVAVGPGVEDVRQFFERNLFALSKGGDEMLLQLAMSQPGGWARASAAEWVLRAGSEQIWLQREHVTGPLVVTPRLRFEVGAQTRSLAFHPNGKELAVVREGACVEVFEYETGRRIAELPNCRAAEVVFDGKGSLFCREGGSGCVSKWSKCSNGEWAKEECLAEGYEFCRFVHGSLPTLLFKMDGVLRLVDANGVILREAACSMQGKDFLMLREGPVLVCAPGGDDSFNTTVIEGKAVKTSDAMSRILSLPTIPDFERNLLYAPDIGTALSIVDPRTGITIDCLRADGSGFGCCYPAAASCGTPDCRWIAFSGFRFDDPGSIVIFDTVMRRVGVASGAHRRHADALAIDTRGRLLASVGSDESQVGIWDVEEILKTGASCEPKNSSVLAVAVNEEAGFVAAAFMDGDVVLWDVDTRESKRVCSVLTVSYRVLCVFDLAGEHLLVAREDDLYIKEYELRSGAETHYFFPDDDEEERGRSVEYIDRIAYSRDGDILCADTSGGRTLLWRRGQREGTERKKCSAEFEEANPRLDESKPWVILEDFNPVVPGGAARETPMTVTVFEKLREDGKDNLGRRVGKWCHDRGVTCAAVGSRGLVVFGDCVGQVTWLRLQRRKSFVPAVVRD